MSRCNANRERTLAGHSTQDEVSKQDHRTRCSDCHLVMLCCTFVLALYLLSLWHRFSDLEVSGWKDDRALRRRQTQVMPKVRSNAIASTRRDLCATSFSTAGWTPTRSVLVDASAWLSSDLHFVRALVPMKSKNACISSPTSNTSFVPPLLSLRPQKCDSLSLPYPANKVCNLPFTSDTSLL